MLASEFPLKNLISLTTLSATHRGNRKQISVEELVLSNSAHVVVTITRLIRHIAEP